MAWGFDGEILCIRSCSDFLRIFSCREMTQLEQACSTQTMPEGSARHRVAKTGHSKKTVSDRECWGDNSKKGSTTPRFKRASKMLPQINEVIASTMRKQQSRKGKLATSKATAKQELALLKSLKHHSFD